MSESTLLCGIDTGTGGVKVAVFSPEKGLVAQEYREYGLITPGFGEAEQIVSEVWSAACDALRTVLANGRVRPRDIAGIAVSSQRATFVGVDESFNPITNYIGWQDKRGAAECEEILKTVGIERFYEITGLKLDPIASVSKIVHMTRTAADAVKAQLYRWLPMQSMILYQLGVADPPCDYSNASYMGMFDIGRLQWSQELLDVTGIEESKLPALVESVAIVGHVSNETSQVTGLKAGTPIIAGGGDLQLMGIGLGASGTTVGLTLGTGAGISVPTDRPVRDPKMGLNCLAHAVPGQWELEGITLATGGTYRWVKEQLASAETLMAQTLGMDVYEVLNLEAASAPLGSRGLIVIPTLFGAGSPAWTSTVRGSIHNLSLDTRRGDLIRGFLEGICMEIKLMVESAIQLGIEIQDVRVSGGASKSSFVNQMLADVLGITVAKPTATDAPTLGAAILAGVGVGVFADVEEGCRRMVSVKERFEPIEENQREYEKIFARFSELYWESVNRAMEYFVKICKR